MSEYPRRVGAAAVFAAAMLLAGCQAGMAPSGGLPSAGAPGGLQVAPAPASARGSAPASTAGLATYKVYNTTETLCERACKAEARCVTHAFSPLSTINGYVAGQCQFYGRS